MSASREKRARKEQGSAAPAQQKQPEKKGMSRTLKTALIALCAVVVVAAVVFFSMITSGFFAGHTTAVTVGSHKLTPAMVNYYYNTSVSNMSSYASYLGIDTSTSLSDQVYNEETGETWGDVLMEQSLTQIAQVYAIYDEAVANGAVLSEEDAASIESTISSLDLYATYNSVANADAYLAAVYGTGCNVDSFREYLTVNALVESYSTAVNDGFTYSDEDLAAEFEANPTDYTTYNYRQFLVSDSLVTGDEETDLSEDELTERKQTLATEIMNAGLHNEQGFIDAAYENASEATKDSYADESYTLRSYTGTSITDAVLAWLSDETREEGDTAAIESSGTWYALYYISSSTNDYQLPNVREIAFDADDTSDEDAMAAAKAEAEAALAEYEAGEQSAEAFIALVQSNTGDESADGLTENVTPGSGSEAYLAWCFDASRAAGDVAVVETDSGYSLVYFDGLGDVYRDTLIESALRSEAYNAWYSGLTENVAYTEQSFGMRFTSK